MHGQKRLLAPANRDDGFTSDVVKALLPHHLQSRGPPCLRHSQESGHGAMRKLSPTQRKVLHKLDVGYRTRPIRGTTEYTLYGRRVTARTLVAMFERGWLEIEYTISPAGRKALEDG